MTLTRTSDVDHRPIDLDEPEDEPKRRISIVRLFLAMIIVAAAGYGIYTLARNQIANLVTVPGTWFAPYVDVTLTPTYPFQLSADNVARQSVLGFVVAQPGSGCTPSWGAAYSLGGADQALNLDSRLAQLRGEGESPIVSFGGQAHTSLQVACTNPVALATAFTSVINRYQLSTIDLDVEGAALNNFAANVRLAEAMGAIQASSTHHGLAVWLTVPVEPSGLQQTAISLITTMLRHHVAIAGVNVLAMDFSSDSPSLNMLGSVENALTNTHQQLGPLFDQFGIRLHSKTLWNRMGATVQIGQNNQANQVFTLSDAHGLDAFARQSGLGRVSVWSLNRDSNCGSEYATTGVLSNICSGVAEQNLGFSKAFAQLAGTTQVGSPGLFSIRPDLNAADSPYPQWNSYEDYVSGYKVVRDGYIYQAKWYNQGTDPAVPTQFQYQSPWLQIGPVLPGSHAPKLPTLPTGTFPSWSATTNYVAGTFVLFNNLPYEAKWDNEDASPADAQLDPAASPWLPLYTIPGEPTTTS
jgi:chitinase